MTEKPLNILYILNNQEVIPSFAQICSQIIKEGHEVHVMYKHGDLKEEILNELKNTPYIYLQEIPRLKQKLSSNINLLWNIRQYLQKHDDINTISFIGIENITVQYLTKAIFKKQICNAISLGDLKKHSKKSLYHNALTKGKNGRNILFLSTNEKKQFSTHPAFQNIKLEVITTSLKPENIAGKLIAIFQVKV